MVEELMGLADNYAICMAAEDCGADPADTAKARDELQRLIVLFISQIPQKIPQNDKFRVGFDSCRGHSCGASKSST